MKYINIAIDGPSGAGKSTVAKAFAKKYGYIYVDTGALYRAIGLFAKRKGIQLKEINEIIPCLSQISLKLEYIDNQQIVFLNNENVNNLIRLPEISMYASAVSSLNEVRAFLLDLQRQIASNNNVVMDGRDIGTVILPCADVKIFLTASLEARAKRRFDELTQKGVNTSYSDVLSDMKIRDDNDRSREIAPAVPAEDAVIFDNSYDDIEKTLEKITKITEDKLGHAI